MASVWPKRLCYVSDEIRKDEVGIGSMAYISWSSAMHACMSVLGKFTAPDEPARVQKVQTR